MRECPDCGQTDSHKFKLHRGARNGRAAELQCLVCEKVFSETYRTPWYRLKIGREKFLAICRMHYLQLSQRKIARRLEINKDTVGTVLDRAGQYPDQVREALIRDHTDLDPRVADLIVTRLEWRWDARRPRVRKAADFAEAHV